LDLDLDANMTSSVGRAWRPAARPAVGAKSSATSQPTAGARHWRASSDSAEATDIAAELNDAK